ncbi:MAG TPA: NADH-quinone oxidoreductase subunit J [Sphingobacteriaceae bacterium]|nr:NADH-quinone oxidoreductase subunit J [Sphingobacteriaceae bacterium]
MNMEQVVFYFFAAMVLVSAFLVVTMNNLVRSIFLFFVTLFSIAGLYIFALADFVALAQVVIYVGGVLVLMLFAFMLSNKELLNDLKLTKRTALYNFPAILVSVIFLFILINVIVISKPENLNWLQNRINWLQPSDNSVHQIGIQVMTRYLLPFEVVSILLLMALIGAAHIARKDKI